VNREQLAGEQQLYQNVIILNKRKAWQTFLSLNHCIIHRDAASQYLVRKSWMVQIHVVAHTAVINVFSSSLSCILFKELRAAAPQHRDSAKNPTSKDMLLDVIARYEKE